MSRGYSDLQQIPITWGDFSAVYSLAEREQMQGLPPSEALILHALKALFGGEILDPVHADELAAYTPPADKPESVQPVRRRRNVQIPGQVDVLGKEVSVEDSAFARDRRRSAHGRTPR